MFSLSFLPPPPDIPKMASGKAIVINKCGGTDVLELVNDFAVPAPKAGEVLVKLVSASINPVDTYVRAGAYAPKEFPKARASFPFAGDAP